jgi:tetratricopeptide (TPR) repeat protein
LLALLMAMVYDARCMSDAPDDFLDAADLLQRSRLRPLPNILWVGVWFGGAAALLFFLSHQLATSKSLAPYRALVQGATSVLMLVLMLGMGYLVWFGVRALRREGQQLEALQELVLLRRWPEAASLAGQLLSGPVRLPQTRLMGLLLLSRILMRYHRFSDAVMVCDELLQTDMLDADSARAVRVDRAMALLHEERLFDADRAISELRRGAQVDQSGGLALLEIYRDVKTGHPDEAIQTFQISLSAMRRQLGHALGEAYALIACALDRLGRPAEAQTAFANATVLMPMPELTRRYGEVAAIAPAYTAARSPLEAA